jgi:hypothetical protein
MSILLERLARCDREIALAVAESHKPHTEAEHAGILGLADRTAKRTGGACGA